MRWWKRLVPHWPTFVSVPIGGKRAAYVGLPLKKLSD